MGSFWTRVSGAFALFHGPDGPIPPTCSNCGRLLVGVRVLRYIIFFYFHSKTPISWNTVLYYATAPERLSARTLAVVESVRKAAASTCSIKLSNQITILTQHSPQSFRTTLNFYLCNNLL